MKELKIYYNYEKKVLRNLIRYHENSIFETSFSLRQVASITHQPIYPSTGIIIEFDGSSENNIKTITPIKNHKLHGFCFKNRYHSGKEICFYKNNLMIGENLLFKKCSKKWQKDEVNKITKDILNEGRDFV